jgi:4,5-dihydroxyphthalate decarboxylase
MPEREIEILLRMQANVEPLRDGRVGVDGFDVRILDESTMTNGFRQMVRTEAFPVSEMALTSYVVAREHGAQFTALPIFLVREFHHGAILFNRRAGISGPKDFEGRCIAVDRGFTVTTGVWARMILAEEHGVDLSRVTWQLSSDEHVPTFVNPPNVRAPETGLDVRAALVAGTIPGAIGFLRSQIPGATDDIVAPYPDWLEAGLAAFDARGHYPINHLIVVRNDVLARYPDLPRALFHAFSESKRLYVEALQSGTLANPTDIDRMHARIMERMPDPLPYGLEPNRALLQGYLDQCHAQGVLRKPVTLDDLFEDSTRDLAG